jgi:hypothetical protein
LSDFSDISRKVKREKEREKGVEEGQVSLWLKKTDNETAKK